jgi:hypothetical protein
MSKKYKGQTRKGTGNGTENSTAASTTAATSRSSLTSFNPDYSYVVKDLRRIGLLAGTFISILVILTFFLR